MMRRRKTECASEKPKGNSKKQQNRERARTVHTGLALHLVGLAVLLLGGDGETTISGHHQHGDVGGGRARDHVLDEVLVAGGIDDGVVLAGREELLGGVVDGDTTLARILLLVAVEGEAERALAHGVGFLCADTTQQ